MKEEVKMKEKMNEPAGTMPMTGAMPQKQSMPAVSPSQFNMPKPTEVSPAQFNMPKPTEVSPAQFMQPMPQMMPVMMCCPYLMNMQCPMTYGNPMMSGVSPAMFGPNNQFPGNMLDTGVSPYQYGGK